MSDVQLLFAVLVALYLWECACWLRRGSVAVATWLGRGWQLLHPGTLIGNQRGGFVLAAPLPPLGLFLTANQLPFTLSPAGVLFFVSTNVNPGWRAAHSGRFVKFDDLHEVRAERRKLIINGEIVLSVASPNYARHLAESLRELKEARSEQRAATISSLLRATLDSQAVEKRWQEAQSLLKPVRRLANALFIFLFAAAPCLIWRLGLGLSWPGLLIALLVLTIANAVYFRRAHRKLFPKLEDERFTFTLTVALAPTTAMRAHDLLARTSCETFHPLAVAKVLLTAADFERFARRVLLDLRHPAQPVCPGGGPELEAAEQHGRTALRAAAEDFLRQAGCDLEKLCAAPAPADEACRAYCLRCEAQFTSLEAQCADCGGLAVVAFPAADSFEPA